MGPPYVCNQQPASAMKLEKFLLLFGVACLVFGALYRLFPILSDARTLSSFFITEDGYLMLTVARNMAIGNGITVANGEVWTNGFQPLTTFLFSVPYLITGGDKVTSLNGIVGLSALISMAAAWAIFAFARQALRPQTTATTWPLLVTALWFVGPLLLLHSMNALETGMYTLMVTVTALCFGHILARGGTYTLRDQIILGSLCGLVFLARNDGAFFVTAIFLVRFIQIQVSRQTGVWGAVKEAFPPGIISLLWAAPWMIYNYRLFGSIMPISGHSQSHSTPFGSNAALSPIKLFETMFPMAPIPNSFDASPVVAVATGAVVLLVLASFLWAETRRGGPFVPVLFAFALYTLMLAGYYGLFFGAAHFLSRYLAPTAPFLITAAVSVGIALAGRLSQERATGLMSMAGLVALVLCIGLLGRLLVPGVKDQGHFQVVDWIDENVAEEVWVGAVQTGTLGYWHDRTINLDGKVNPDALRALMTEGHALDYAVRSKLDYIADWVGMARWIDAPVPAFARTFEVIVEDQDKNLSVLRRRSSSS